MTKHRVLPENEVAQIAEFIRTAKDGDEIVCRNEVQVMLGECSAPGLCPHKELTFSVASGQVEG